MEIASETLHDTITKIALSGRLDLQGNQAIEMKLTSLAATRKAGVVIDMSGVEFLASIGMRTLISNAKAQANRGGELVRCNLQPLVKDVLSTSGIDSIIQVFEDCDSAVADADIGRVISVLGVTDFLP